MNRYAEAISILEKVASGFESTDETRLLFEIARSNPGVLVKVYQKLWPPQKAIDVRIIKYAEAGNGKVACIKYCRAITGEGLREAKEHVEGLYNNWPSL